MSLCELRRGPYFNKKSVWVQRLWSEETNERISDEAMEEDYFERFLKHSKEQCTNAWKCDSGRPRTSRTAANTSDVYGLVLSQEDAAQTNLTSWQIARKAAVRIIRADLRLHVLEKNEARSSCPKPKQIVSTVCYKINLSWYPVSSKLEVTHGNIGDALRILCSKNCGYWLVFVELAFHKVV